MLGPGSYADTLRALGRSLHEANASEVGIVDHGDHIEVSWRGPDGESHQQAYDAPALAELQTMARSLRDRDIEVPRSALTDCLRSLGQELDDRAVAGITIAEITGGYWASWTEKGQKVTATFRSDDLVAKALEHQARRTAEPKPAGGLFARILPGGEPPSP